VPNYVFAYSGGGMPETEEEQARVMADWGAWYEDMGEAIVDGGNPFGPSTSVAPGGAVDGDAPSRLSGYSIVAADDLGAATNMAKECPILASGGRVDVYETIQMM
jgi:hypothetical protein